jgi:hypothetical protein
MCIRDSVTAANPVQQYTAGGDNPSFCHQRDGEGWIDFYHSRILIYLNDWLFRHADFWRGGNNQHY